MAIEGLYTDETPHDIPGEKSFKNAKEACMKGHSLRIPLFEDMYMQSNRFYIIVQSTTAAEFMTLNEM